MSEQHVKTNNPQLFLCQRFIYISLQVGIEMLEKKATGSIYMFDIHGLYRSKSTCYNHAFLSSEYEEENKKKEYIITYMLLAMIKRIIRTGLDQKY